MTLHRLAAGIAIVLGLHTPVQSAMYEIKNPADKIQNPAGTMYNPATQVNNPASNIYNPAARTNDPNPLSPPVQPVPQQAEKESKSLPQPLKLKKEQSPSKPVIPQKNYKFKTAGEYIIAAKKAFIKDDFREFISIVEDALRRINAGTLKASQKTRQKLSKYKAFGYGLLE
jgi:uncharacterized membrane protein